MTNVTAPQWGLEQSAATLVESTLNEAVLRSPQTRAFVNRLQSSTSTKLLHWVDHLSAPLAPDALRRAGFVDGYRTTPGIWRHPIARYPAIVPDETWTIGIRVDNVEQFVQAMDDTAIVSGSPQSGLRRAVVARDGTSLVGVERRSWNCGLDAQVLSADESARTAEAWQIWARGREALSVAPRVEQLRALALRVVGLVGADRAASHFLEQAREKWEARNRAGTLQRSRQDELGLGWGNRDHHTFRSSRDAFPSLLTLFAAFGFALREPFYPGATQGWAAQVLEHPGTGDVIFTDVDLAPGSTEIDLDATPAAPTHLGTIGLWCALHGESILDAGMHHLAAEFDFDRLCADLAQLGINHMPPFSELPYLRQAFTEPEYWPVPQARLDALVRQGLLTLEQAATIDSNGAIGSHLENIVRAEGFKGFNSHNISDALRSTDPRG